MSTTFKPSFAGYTNIVCSIDGLTSSTTVGRASTVVDNSSNLYQDALLAGYVKTASGTIGTFPVVYVYGYADVDTTPHYTESVTGSDAGFTRADPTNLRLIGIVSVPASATDYYFGPFSVAAAFGGILPKKWGITVVNTTGLALTGTAGQNTTCLIGYAGVNQQGI